MILSHESLSIQSRTPLCVLTCVCDARAPHVLLSVVLVRKPPGSGRPTLPSTAVSHQVARPTPTYEWACLSPLIWIEPTQTRSALLTLSILRGERGKGARLDSWPGVLPKSVLSDFSLALETKSRVYNWYSLMRVCLEKVDDWRELHALIPSFVENTEPVRHWWCSQSKGGIKNRLSGLCEFPKYFIYTNNANYWSSYELEQGVLTSKIRHTM